MLNKIKILAPVKPSDKDLASIKKAAERIFGLKNVELEFIEDKNLLGGFKLVSGSTALDLSIAGKLNQIEDELENG
jgi:F0F1-type ATP synthase delta subunit